MTDQPAHWTRHYFGHLYGELYRKYLLKRSRSNSEADFAATVLNLKNSVVLDLAAGFGRHALPLSKSNHVVALDLQREYLASAVDTSSVRPSESRKTSSRKRTGSLSIIQADMRAIPLTDRSMDAVLLLFNSFGYFGAEIGPATAGAEPQRAQLWKLPEVFYARELVTKEFGLYQHQPQTPTDREDVAPTNAAAEADTDPNEIVLREVARVLRPRGSFLMELPNPGPLLAAVRSEPRRHVITSRYEIEEDYQYDAVRKVLSNRTRFRMEGQEENAEYYLRIYTRREIQAMLKKHGFTLTRAFGSYDGEAYSASQSELMLIHARRK